MPFGEGLVTQCAREGGGQHAMSFRHKTPALPRAAHVAARKGLLLYAEPELLEGATAGFYTSALFRDDEFFARDSKGAYRVRSGFWNARRRVCGTRGCGDRRVRRGNVRKGTRVCQIEASL